MPDQLDSNLNFEDRTQEVQRSIKSLLEKIGRDENEIIIIYDQMNWGSLSNSVLYTALLEMENDLNIKSAEQILADRRIVTRPGSREPGTDEDLEELSETWVRRRQPVITKDISWFINNGDSEEIKNKALKHRERMLLDLYLEHVKMTGETYFPELHRLLKAEWDFSYRNEE